MPHSVEEFVFDVMFLEERLDHPAVGAALRRVDLHTSHGMEYLRGAI